MTVTTTVTTTKAAVRSVKPSPSPATSVICPPHTAINDTYTLPFTISEVREKIPTECFEINEPLAFYYFFRDLFFLALCYIVYPYLSLAPSLLYWPLKVLWWNVTGFFGWCIFCGNNKRNVWRSFLAAGLILRCFCSLEMYMLLILFRLVMIVVIVLFLNLN